MSEQPTRREALRRAGAAGAGAAVALGLPQAAAAARRAADEETPGERFGYCLNTSTIRGQNLTLVGEVEIAATAGYQAIEPWINEIERYQADGGSLADLRKRIADRGLTVASAIGFAEWIVDDDTQRTKGLEDARRQMDLVAQIGGTRIAAPPAGATGQSGLDLFRAAERYGELLAVGEQAGVVRRCDKLGQITFGVMRPVRPDRACFGRAMTDRLEPLHRDPVVCRRTSAGARPAAEGQARMEIGRGQRLVLADQLCRRAGRAPWGGRGRATRATF